MESETEELPESSNCQKVLQTIACGMYATSDNYEIIQWCLRLLTKLAEDLNAASAVSDLAYKWFLEEEGGFELCLHALSNHTLNDIGEDIVSLLN